MQTGEDVSLTEMLQRQQQLEAAARRKFPWDPTECTLYMDIPPRQILFACLTCKPENSICYACGLRCHADHHLVELYSKRGFRCDCGTTRNPGVCCSLRKTENDAWANPHMHYGQNFQGKFCVCSESTEDVTYGEGAMFQCLLGTHCGEDWFHARCIVGITREEEMARKANETRSESSVTMSEESGDEIETMYPELPDVFGAMICPQCAPSAPQLADSPAVLSVVNGYIFLNEDYGEIISSSPPLSKLLGEFPFLSGHEDSYYPDKDNDNSTLLEAGERALQGLPRDAVLNGLERFNQMQTNLVQYLREIAADGHAVTREEVEAFFSSQGSG